MPNGGSSLSSVQKFISILDLFSIERPAYSADEIIAALKCSRPQGYRHLRELCRAGFLTRSAAVYRLGARAIELDYIVRHSDPLLQAAIPTMRTVRDQSGCDALLISLVGDRIITVHHERGTDPATVSYSRGRVMPRFRGAGSKAILAALPLGRQRAFFNTFREEEADSQLGATWDEVRQALKQIKRSGHAISEGELDRENIAIAAPVFLDAPEINASLVLVMGEARYRTTDVTSVVRLVSAAAQRIVDTVLAAPLPQVTPVATDDR